MTLRLPGPHDADTLQQRVLEAIGSMFGSEPTISSPFRVDAVDLESVAAGSLVGHDQGSIVRWQCLVGSDEPEAMVDLLESVKDYAVVSVNGGTLAERFANAVSRADELTGGVEYELRIRRAG